MDNTLNGIIPVTGDEIKDVKTDDTCSGGCGGEQLAVERVDAPADPPALIIPAPEKDYADKSAHAEPQTSRARLLPILKLTSAAVLIGVFAAAAYADIAHAASSFTVDSIADLAADAAFGISLPTVSAPDVAGTPPAASSSHSDASGFHELYLGADEHSNVIDGGMNSDDIDDSFDTPPITDETADADTRYPIVARDLSATAARGLECSNQTDYDLDLDYFADAPLKIAPLSELLADGENSVTASTSNEPASQSPVVLIIHTHGTESYAPEGADTYSPDDSARSDDITQNVVAVGSVMTDYFESRGIPTVHCTEMFDRDSYIDAYKNSSAAVHEYLAMYPSIKYIFDVHRDSVIASDYTKYRPVTDVDGGSAAQFMCVVGTNFKGADHPHWRDNLTLAAHLQTRLWTRSTSLPRRMSIRGASFYQQYAPGSLLLEIGSCGNTLTEAEACARIVAEELAELIIQE